MRWTHGSRRAVSVGRANPPNLSSGRGRRVGPRGTPAGLSVVPATGALSAYRDSTPFGGVHVLSVGACLYRLFIFEKKKKYGGH